MPNAQFLDCGCCDDVMVGAVLARAVVRGGTREVGSSRAASDVEVYRAQLGEVDRDVARGVIAKADAERVHAEIARRLIAADKAQTGESCTAHRQSPRSCSLDDHLVGLVGQRLYWWLGAPGYGDMASRIASHLPKKFANHVPHNRWRKPPCPLR